MAETWDPAKLDTLFVDIQNSTKETLEDERKAGLHDEDSIGTVVGYWMYRLRDCKAKSEGGNAVSKMEAGASGSPGSFSKGEN